MPSEPNLRLNESLFSGRPYGYGFIPVPRSLRFPAQPPTADSRPQQFAQHTAGAGDLAASHYRPLPGFWASVGGLLVAPFRWLRWMFTTPGVRVAALAFSILGFLGVACVPLITTTGGDSRRSEAEQMMGSTKARIRAIWAKTDGDMDSVPKELDEMAARGELTGKYFIIEPRIEVIDESSARIFARPLNPDEYPGYHEFSWADGGGHVHWEWRRKDD